MSDERNEFDNGNDSRYAYETVSSFGKPKSMAWSLISMITGIISVGVAIFGWAGIALGAVAIVCSVVSRRTLGYFDKMSVVGLILGIFGIVFGVSLLIAVAIAGDDFWQAMIDSFKDGYDSFASDGGFGI